MTVSPWSATLTFGLRALSPTGTNTMDTRMRMPLQQAKALAVMLLRTLRQYEQQSQVEIELPKTVLDELNIPLEDWQRFRGVG